MLFIIFKTMKCATHRNVYTLGRGLASFPVSRLSTLSFFSRVFYYMRKRFLLHVKLEELVTYTFSEVNYRCGAVITQDKSNGSANHSNFCSAAIEHGVLFTTQNFLVMSFCDVVATALLINLVNPHTFNNKALL